MSCGVKQLCQRGTKIIRVVPCWIPREKNTAADELSKSTVQTVSITKTQTPTFETQSSRHMLNPCGVNHSWWWVGLAEAINDLAAMPALTRLKLPQGQRLE